MQSERNCGDAKREAGWSSQHLNLTRNMVTYYGQNNKEQEITNEETMIMANDRPTTKVKEGRSKRKCKPTVKSLRTVYK